VPQNESQASCWLVSTEAASVTSNYQYQQTDGCCAERWRTGKIEIRHSGWARVGNVACQNTHSVCRSIRSCGL